MLANSPGGPARPGLRLVIKFGWTGSAQSASELYHYATERLAAAYAGIHAEPDDVPGGGDGA